MKDLKKLKAAAEKARKAADSAKKALEDADDDTREALQKAYDEQVAAAKAAVDELKEAVEEAKEKKAVDDIMKQAEDLTKVKVPGGVNLAVNAIDHDAEDNAQVEAFKLYCTAGWGHMSGEQCKLVKNENPSFKLGEGGARLPKRLIVGLFPELAKAFGMASKALPLTSVNPNMTALIPPDYRAQVLEVPAEAVHVLPRATIVPSATGTIQWPRLVQSDANEYGAVAVGWTDEGATKQQSEAKFDQVTIQTHEVSAWTQLSHRLLKRSAIDLGGYLGRLFRAAILNAIDAALINGTGVGQPAGIIGTAGIRQVARAAAGAVSYDDLVDLKYAVKPYHRASGIFLAEDQVLQGLEKAKDTQGRPLFTASTMNGIYDRLVGKTYIGSTRLPALGITGDVIFFDPKEYIVAMEEDVVVRRSDDYDFPKNVATFAFYAVVGGQLVQPRTAAILVGTVS